MYRSTWSFALVTLLPLATSKKELVLLITIVAVSIFAGLLYVKYFYEFVPIFYNYAIEQLHSQGIIAFIKTLFGNFIRNVYRYFLSYNYGFTHVFLKLILIFIFSVFVLLTIKSKRKIFQAMALLFSINFLFLFLFWDAHSWRDIRFLSPLFYFSIIILAKYFNTYLKLGIVISVMLFFLIAPIEEFKKDRDKFDLSTIELKQASLERILSESENKALVLINFAPKDYSLTPLILPVRANNNLVKYIALYYDVKIQKHNFILEQNHNLIPVLY